MNSIYFQFIEALPHVTMQTERDLTTMWRTTAPSDPMYFVYFLLGVAVLAAGVNIGTYQYHRWKRYKEFENEMKTLDLDTEAEGTLVEMVKRHELDQPVQVLLSARMFDEMAVSEIERVLASPGSAKAKQHFIDTIYTIRMKTYFPDRMHGVVKSDPLRFMLSKNYVPKNRAAKLKSSEEMELDGPIPSRFTRE